MAAREGYFSRDELLGGLPAKRASTLLFAIENRTAQFVEQSRHAAAVYLTYAGSQTREQDFFAAFARARAGSISVSIQDIERYAPQWTSLLPEKLDANLNAALAQLLSGKYTFTHQASAHLRAALQLDEAAVQQAFQRLYDKPLTSIYAPRVTTRERLRWAWAAAASRLDRLPPFWLAFALTLPGAAGLLGMPIAMAKVGPTLGITLLVVFGLINMLTAAALAETMARSGTARFGLGFLGQLVHEYLGNAGSLFLTAILALNNFFVLIIFYMGVAGTLESATHLPTVLWVALMFGICLYFLRRGSLNATVTSSLIIVLINVVCLLLIPLLALPHFKGIDWMTGQFANLQSLDPTALQPVFGILLSTFFSHILIASYGPAVLRREPSARSWIRGSAAAILCFVLISVVWLVMASGVIAPDVLAKSTGTVLQPLAEKVGPIVLTLGSLLVVLSLGLASVQIALGLYYLVQERLPQAASTGQLNQRRRFLLSISPVVGVFVLAEFVAITGVGSFASFLGILSAFVLPLLGGIFPVLLLASTRRKGDFVPGVVYRLLGNKVILTAVYLFFLAIIFTYGFFIFDTVVPRALAIFVGLVTIAITIVVLRRGALKPRTVIELRDDQRGTRQASFTITTAGEAMPGQVEMVYGNRTQSLTAATNEIASFTLLKSVLFHLPATTARELKVWVHRLLPEGGSQGLTVQLEVHDRTRAQQIELSETNSQAVLPLDGSARDVRITLP